MKESEPMASGAKYLEENAKTMGPKRSEAIAMVGGAVDNELQSLRQGSDLDEQEESG